MGVPFIRAMQCCMKGYSSRNKQRGIHGTSCNSKLRLPLFNANILCLCVFAKLIHKKYSMTGPYTQSIIRFFSCISS